MTERPRPPKLTPHQRAFLAGELYPPKEPSKHDQPSRLSKEVSERGLKGVARARATLKRGKEAYEEGTQGMWGLAGRALLGVAAKGIGGGGQSSGPSQSAGGINAYNMAGTQGQWYDVGPSPGDYFKEGTHGQVYENYGASGFSQPAVSTPKRAGPPPPGATSTRPVEDKPPTLSSRSYFSSGTQGQPMSGSPRVPGRKQRKKRDSTKDSRPPVPRTDKTTTHDTLTREEWLRFREEEVEKERNKPTEGEYVSVPPPHGGKRHGITKT